MNILSQLEKLIENGFGKDDIVLLISIAPDLFKVSKSQVETYFDAIDLLQKYKDINAKLSGMESSALNKRLLEEIDTVEKKDRPVLNEKNNKPKDQEIIVQPEEEIIPVEKKINEEKKINGVKEEPKFNLDPYAFDSFVDEDDSLSKFFPDMNKNKHI